VSAFAMPAAPKPLPHPLTTKRKPPPCSSSISSPQQPRPRSRNSQPRTMSPPQPFLRRLLIRFAPQPAAPCPPPDTASANVACTPFVDNFQSSCLNPDLGRLFWLEVRKMPPLLLAGGSSFCIEDLLFATAILCHPVAVFRWLFLEALRSSPRLIFSKFTPAQTLFRAEGTRNQLTASASTLERDDEAM
jgi:hypothetical protein